MKRLFTLFLLIAPLTALGACELHVSESWIREAPPTAQVLAAYMRLENQGDTDCRIDSVNSPMFDAIEIHRTEIRNGIARMIMQPGLDIAAGKTVIAEPGGLHLMLMQPRRPLSAGERIPINLRLEDTRTIGVFAPVRRIQP